MDKSNKTDECNYNSSQVLSNAWVAFNKKFNTAEDCYDYLFVKMQENNQANCKFCGQEIKQKAYGERISNCSKCGNQFWLTSGTFFENTRKIKAWFAVIWLLEKGFSINPSIIEKLTGIAYSTAWEIFKKVSIVINGYITKRCISIHSSAFSSLFCKRSRITPTGLHPIEELGDSKDGSISSLNYLNPNESDNQEFEDSDLQNKSNTHDKENELSPSLSDQEVTVLNLLTNEKISFDEICKESSLSPKEVSATLTLLEISQNIVSVGGNQFKLKSKIHGNRRKKNSQDEEIVDKELLNYADVVIEHVKDSHHGISRKYLQNYIALLWCKHSRKRWSDGSLFEACWKSNTITYRQILEYISPYQIEVAISAYKPQIS